MEWIEVYNIEKIASNIDAMRWGNVLGLFGLSINQIKIPTGEIDLLVGMNYAAFHPQMVEANSQLVLYRSSFGMCLGGSHPCLQNEVDLVISNATVNHVKGRSVGQFFEIEDLGFLENIGEYWGRIPYDDAR